jgi:uncharacterized protein (TIGR03437 family)
MRFSALLLLILPGAAFAQPAIFYRGIVNSANYAGSGLPSGGVAQGSLFTIFGSSLGPTTGVSAPGYPLNATLQGVSISLTQGATQLTVYPLYVSAGQIDAIMPSNAPLGIDTIRVTVNSQPSNLSPVKVVNSAFGLYSASGVGSGPGGIQNFVTKGVPPTNSTQAAAPPGSILILYGTGLGPISAPDNEPPPTENVLPGRVQAFVGGVSAAVAYAGRAPCCAGEDQITITVPITAPQGCWVPLYLTVSGVTSNAVTAAIGKPGACTDSNPLAKTFINGGNVGSMRLIRSNTYQNIAILQAGTVSTDVFTEDLSKVQGGPFVFSPLFSEPPAGTCSLFFTPNSFWSSQGGFTTPTTVTAALDAGATFSLKGNGNTTALTPAAGFSAVPLGSSATTLPTIASQLVLNPGSYTLSAPGGADVKPFKVNLSMPQPFVWNDQQILDVVNRSEDLTLTWSGLPAGQTMTIMGGNADFPSNSSAIFYCVAPPNVNTFTIPTSILAAIPPTRPDDRKSRGMIYVMNSSPGNGVPIKAEGLDAAVAVSTYMFGKTVIFQ